MDHAPAESALALKYEVIVQKNGRIEMSVPFLPGKKVVVFVFQEHGADDEQDVWTDLMSASASSLDFWDNVYDDEDWNNT